MDRALLLLSTLCFGLAFAGSVTAMRRAATGGGGSAANRGITSGRGRWHAAALGLGFLLQTWFLVVRGQAAGRCPLTGPGETLAFVAWATVLFHLLIGNAYRLSPLGAFTAPAAFALQVGALVAFGAPGTRRPAAADPWLEFHAAFSVLAYGAFALAAVAGGLYLWQERQLKSRRPHPLFFFFPPMGDLGRVNGRLLGVGFALLTAGLAAGWVALGAPRSNVHFLCAVATWALYGGLVLARWRHFLAPRRLATLSLAALGVAFVTLGGITFVEGGRHEAEDGKPEAPPPLTSPAATSRHILGSPAPRPDLALIPTGQPLS